MLLTFCLTFLLITLTGYGVWLGFGKPSKQLEDPFDSHHDHDH